MAKTNKRRKLVKKYAEDPTPPPPPPPPPTVAEKKIKKKNNKIKKHKLPKPESVESPVSDKESDPQIQIHTLLEPFSKEQLVKLLTDLSLSHRDLFALIHSVADQDISHRKIFIRGLGWDATQNLVESVFRAYGEIEDLNVVNDRSTGKCKGYAFLTFKTRKSAKKLLKTPKVEVGNRMTSCQLASEGPAASIPAGTVGVVSQQNFPSSDYPQRKIYVNNVQANVSAERLRAFFEQFGEIESGPKGFDPETGRFKGYALFVYKTAEAARKVLEEPYKAFDGCQLHCQKANEGKGLLASGSASITTAMQPVQPQMLAAAAQQQAQSLAMFGQQPGIVNPLYAGGMIANPNLAGGMIANPNLAGGMIANPNLAGGLIANPNLGTMMGGYYGMMGGQMPGLGAYGVTGTGDGGSMLQGLQYLYPTGQNSASSLGKPPGNSGGYSPT